MSLYQSVLRSQSKTIIGNLYTTIWDSIWAFHQHYCGNVDDLAELFDILSVEDFIDAINDAYLDPKYELSVIKHKIYTSFEENEETSEETSSGTSSGTSSSTSSVSDADEVKDVGLKGHCPSDEEVITSDSEGLTEDEVENLTEAANISHMLTVLCPFYHPCFGFNAEDGLIESYAGDQTMSLKALNNLRYHDITASKVILCNTSRPTSDHRAWYNETISDPDWLPALSSRPWITVTKAQREVRIYISKKPCGETITVDDILFAARALTNSCHCTYDRFSVLDSTRGVLRLCVHII